MSGDWTLPEILDAPFSNAEKALECLARLGLREVDDIDLRTAAVVFAVLEVANELALANPE